MKQVVKVIENKVVDINSVSVDKYYGFMLYDGSAGQIVGDDMLGLEKDNSYQAKFFTNSTSGNPWSIKYSSLKDCIDDVLSGTNDKVFEFDTYQELFQWASATL